MYMVDSKDLGDPSVITEIIHHYCQNIIENGKTIIFIPKDGFLATLGLFFTEKGISYQLEFKKTSCLNCCILGSVKTSPYET